MALLERAAAASPNSAEIENHLGNALQDAGNQALALEAYRRAAAADPNFGPALQNLGYLLVSQGRTDEGVDHLRDAQRVEPRDINRLLISSALPVIYASEAEVAERRGRFERELQDLVDEGFTIDTEATLVPTNFFGAYQGENDRDVHTNLGRIFRGPDLTANGASARTPGGPHRRERPRIGFLSAYFRDHTIGRLNLGRIQRISHDRFEIVVLSAGAARDPMAQQFEAAADQFVRIPREVATARRMIHEQDLDLLFFTDVGMDARTYTLAFSRMAPVQCVTWGHPVTTGSPHMDYFVSSELLETPEADSHYTERLVRLPSLGTYYPGVERPSVDGTRTRLGLADTATIYACPQTLFKFHPEFDRLLAEILRRDPNGVLVLIEGRVDTWTALLRERFQRSMPDVMGQITWLKALPRPAFLELLAASDVVLDPTKFGGGNSTYEALAMGAPVVTLPNELMRTRISRALYARAGYEDLVAQSEEQYVEIAVRLGTDPAYRASARAAIADRCAALFEDDREIRDLEAFLSTAVSNG